MTEQEPIPIADSNHNIQEAAVGETDQAITEWKNMMKIKITH